MRSSQSALVATTPRSLVLSSLFIGKVRNMFWSFLDAASHQSPIDGQLIKTGMHSLKKIPVGRQRSISEEAAWRLARV
jgi:hypothetical protein